MDVADGNYLSRANARDLSDSCSSVFELIFQLVSVFWTHEGLARSARTIV